MSSILMRKFGKANVEISALGLGGHHVGAAKDEATAIALVHRALDGGITFYDTAGNISGANRKTGSGKVLRAGEIRHFS